MDCFVPSHTEIPKNTKDNHHETRVSYSYLLGFVKTWTFSSTKIDYVMACLEQYNYFNLPVLTFGLLFGSRQPAFSSPVLSVHHNITQFQQILKTLLQ
jgi:hypothetical protein